jgi:hypothetical protein
LVAYSKTAGFNDFDNPGSAAILIRDSSNNGIATYANSVEVVTAPITPSANHRLGIIFDGTNITPYVDGVAGTSGAYSHSWISGGPFSVGNNKNANAGWDGAVAEVVVATRDCTSQVTQLDNYFKAQ